MRGFKLGTLSVLALLALAGCGGPVDEASEAPVTPEPAIGEVEAGLACTTTGYCPGTTTCVNGICRDCVRYPHWCD
jgi:hypothetical protein